MKSNEAFQLTVFILLAHEIFLIPQVTFPARGIICIIKMERDCTLYVVCRGPTSKQGDG